MKTSSTPPDYNVEFLLLERRLIERRGISHHLTFLPREQRKRERRMTPSESTLSSLHGATPEQ